MSLLGLDVGTTGSKAVVFDTDGSILGSSYVEYEISRPQPGHAELDAASIWPKIRDTIGAAVAYAREMAAASGRESNVTAIAVDSMGENLVPVSRDGRILGPSIMNMDSRGAEYLPAISQAFPADALYQITGNTISNQFSIGKLMWVRENLPSYYDAVDYFLPWNSFVSFMLGAEPAAEYALASRTLLFDLDRADWSDDLMRAANLDRAKMPKAVPAGTAIGAVATNVAGDIGISAGTPIIIGAHDQPSASLGSGATAEGVAMYGMGTFHCIAPTFAGRKPPDLMVRRGLNTEHHALPSLFLTLIYNSGGAAVKWFRDTFAGGDTGYAELFREMPAEPASVTVVPHFTAMGPPDFIDQPNAAIHHMSLGTTRGEILRGLVEANTYSLKMSIDARDEVEITINELRPTGGGSKSDDAVQIAADILRIPCKRPEVTEASALGCAMLAGAGSGVFKDVDEAAASMIRMGKTFEPDGTHQDRYTESYEDFLKLRKAATSAT